jgi:hypothetical protein
MPNVSTTIPEVNESVMRPVVIDIIKQLFTVIKIPQDTPIYFPDGVQAVAQKGATLSEQETIRDNTRLAFDSMVQVEVSEAEVEGSILSTSVRNDDNPPIFHDPDCGVLIRPAYSSTKVTIGFRCQFKSETEAKRWRDSIRMATSAMRDVNLHNAAYHYPIPEPFVDLLREIHSKREAVDPYGQTFEDYLGAYSSARLTVISNQAGECLKLAVRESQVEIQGMFDFEAAPERATNENNSNVWIGNFTYNFYYDKPLLCSAKYPIIIHNQLLDNKFIQFEQLNVQTPARRWSMSLGYLSGFRAQDQIKNGYVAEKTISVPEFDDFIPKNPFPKVHPLMNILVTVDTTTPKLILNLNDLGDYNLDSDILKFMLESEASYLTKPYQSIMQVCMYQGMECMTPRDYQISSTGDVTSTYDLPLRKSNRFVLGVVTDLAMLPKAALIRLRNNKAAGIKILQAIAANSADLLAMNQIADLSAFLPYVPNVQVSLKQLQQGVTRRKTVQVSSVIALRRNG